jgi:cytochrome c oxidase subunit III
MSSTAEATTGAHTDHAHPAWLAHHFDTPQHQFDAGKMGIWVFLVTEVLFFSGLFCAYAVYRSTHPEIFIYAHHFLDKTWGAVNTIVLLFSSLTMAWGVRCSQTNNKNGTVLCLALTLLCAFAFLGVKYVEYKGKWEHGLLWGDKYKPVKHDDHGAGHGEAKGGGHGEAAAKDAAPAHDAGGHGTPNMIEPRNVSIFFSIYFCMTGLHAIHIIIGIIVIGWVMLRAMKGEFHDQYFGPVDYAGLYWHLVDLIWIYLFPLLYLIH